MITFPLAATFALNHPDSVVRSAKNGQARSAQRAWWEALAALSAAMALDPDAVTLKNILPPALNGDV